MVSLVQCLDLFCLLSFDFACTERCLIQDILLCGLSTISGGIVVKESLKGTTVMKQGSATNKYIRNDHPRRKGVEVYSILQNYDLKGSCIVGHFCLKSSNSGN